MKISVIIPVYNTEKTVGAAIESVLAQSEQDFEVIAVDDGSPDGAAKVLAEYAARDSRVRVIRQANRGLSGARNTGLDNAKGEWITFLDSDDALPRHALATFLKAAEAAGVDIVVSEGPVDVESEEAKRAAVEVAVPAAQGVKISETPLETVIAGRRMRSSAWNKFYRRGAIGSLRFIEGIYFEDWPFVTTILGSVKKIAVVKAPCYVYSKIGESIVRSGFNEKKAESYLIGIRTVMKNFAGRSLAKTAAKRAALAAAMLINKISKSRDGGSSWKSKAIASLSEVFREFPLVKHYLPFKSRFRWWRMTLEFTHFFSVRKLTSPR